MNGLIIILVVLIAVLLGSVFALAVSQNNPSTAVVSLAVLGLFGAWVNEMR